MKYCQLCITPYNRPNIEFDERGHCNCATAKEKDSIDWAHRERLFRALAEEARSRSKGYDCVIPVSGGKDSTWQVVTCFEHGLKPLCVTWKPPRRTATGQKNLANLISLGVDHVDFSIKPQVEKKFMYQALVRYGSPAVPMHMALFAIPLTIAVKFQIPLVVWGENSAFEYGGEKDDRDTFELSNAWLRSQGCTFGTVAEDWVGPELSRQDLQPYVWPTDEELGRAGAKAVFLGAFFRWDPRTTYEIAAAHGFTSSDEGPKTGFHDFADIDDAFISIHHWLKWYKFGFTRMFDNLSLDIRNGRMTRDEAIDVLRRAGDQTPHRDIEQFCAYVGITTEHFFKVVERFRNPEVWTRRNGRWVIDDFIVPGWRWP
jgi:N-acetyl sugar amidotransferase